MGEQIWSNPDAARALAAFIEKLMSLQNMSSLGVEEELRKIEPDRGRRVTRTTLESFLQRHKINRQNPKLATLSKWAIQYTEVYGCAELKSSSEFEELKSFASIVETADAARGGRAPTKADLAKAVALISSLMHVEQGDMQRLENALFSERDRDAAKERSVRHFLCYRYHSQPGKIAKSFLVIMGKAADVPGVCRFANFFKGLKGAPRQSNGIVLPFSHGVYFIGESEKGAGLKLIAMRAFNTNDPTHEGLLISYEEDGTPITARVVLKPTTITHSDQASIAVYDETNPVIAEEIAPFVQQLRNQIPFKLNHDIFLDGNAIDQKQMVVAVQQAFTGANSQPRLVDGQGKPFNPADHSHYTFNSALRLWSSN